MGHHPIRRGAAIVLAVTAITVLASCSDDEESTTTDAPASGDSAAPAGGGAELTIQGSTFGDLTVAAGTEFTISNNDGFAHTVTSDDDLFDVSVSGGGSETLTIDEAGTYAFHCKIHSSMHGTVVVT